MCTERLSKMAPVCSKSSLRIVFSPMVVFFKSLIRTVFSFMDAWLAVARDTPDTRAPTLVNGDASKKYAVIVWAGAMHKEFAAHPQGDKAQ